MTRPLVMKNSAICVLGMHRSGTSALTGALGLLGVELGDALLPATKDNENGFWEHLGILDIHERLLASLGSSWDDVRPLSKEWWTGPRVAPFRPELAQILGRHFVRSPVWGVKDPRMCRLAPLWLEVLDTLGCRSYFIIIHRHPLEVARSLERRNGFTSAKSALLWIDHNLSAEKWSRGRTRVFVSFDQLLSDPQATLERIGRQTGLEFPKRVAETFDAIHEYLSPELRHHLSRTVDLDAEFGAYNSLVAATYRALTAACEQETVEAHATFDRLQQDYHAVVSSFDPAVTSHVGDLQTRLEDLQNNLNRLQMSASWQLTRPLRRVKRLLQRVVGA